MQPASLTGRQQQLGLLMGRSQPDVLEAARVAALLNGQSGSFSLQSGLGAAGLGSGVLAGLGGTSAGLNLSLGPLPQASQQAPQSSQLALPDQLALLSQFPHALLPPQQYSSADRDLQIGGLRNVGKTRSSDSRSSSAYASRHQAAEQRRRTRINERLELLRKLVPHAERANTACFLEEVIKYIEALKRRTLELESALEAATGKPVAKSLGPQGVVSGGASGPGGLEPATADSPRLPASGPAGSQQQQVSVPHPPSASGGGGATASPSPLAPPAPPALSTQQQSQQQQTSAQQQQGLDLLSGAAQAGGASAGAGSTASQHHSPQLQLASSVSSQLAHLLPGGVQGASAASQQAALGALFPHSGGALSLAAASGSLSLGGGAGGSAGALSLAQLTAGLHPHSLGGGSGGLLSNGQGHHHHHHHHTHHLTAAGASSHAAVTQQQLSDLQAMQVMHSLQQQHQQQQQQARAAAAAAAAHQHAHQHHPSSFHPTNNKAAFLHFNEDLFGGIKPELLGPSRSQLGGAAATTSTTPSTSLQLTSAHLPTDSNTMLQVETARKTLSGSPVSSEESGVPLKKRKVLLL
ncbi:hypothetical protein PLESTB_000406000 [Pleodorina starrii]|uniref:BHLH domain-containing protein n=1 Tax=Pleodorina starrii TaxID=330485 RepID=A0A9W6BEP7_9CHLO|nr:hypothetical protein PLESTM_001501400 [Pleodorina starrii]GLC50673.1 hypothetical protein PLESTB_000406000 [Pleodorina starrii]GLC75285.1 hypothetical protein PLESTF_001617400 [Pleodorina starrii]